MIRIREMKAGEYSALENFLYQAVFVSQGSPKPSREIIHLPELQLYIEDFGQKAGDIALVAEKDHQLIGAV